MVLHGAKSCRVLSRGNHLMIAAAGSKNRAIAPKQATAKAGAKLNRAVRSEVAEVKRPTKSRVLVKKSAVVKQKPAPRRMVQRVPAVVEKDVGNRARRNVLTVLEQRSVSSEIQGQYTKYHQQFMSFCRENTIELKDPEITDAALADFMDVMFVEGRSAAEGEKMVAAVEYMDVRLRGRLIRCRRALKGWRKEMPAKSRLPLPRILAYGIAMVLLARGKKLMSLKVLLDHDTYMRPGESLALRSQDIVAPVRGGGRNYQAVCIVIRDQEWGQPDKVGVFDNTLRMDSKGREFIGELMLAQARRQTSGDSLIFPFTAKEFREHFRAAGEALGVQALHPYQLRHGGAADDLNGQERHYAEVKARGRWLADTSVRRYTKVGKLQQLLSRLSPSDMEYCRWSLQHMEKVHKGLLPPRSH